MNFDTKYMLEAALNYAAKGWPIVPVHGITEDGGCTCRKIDCKGVGKHPMVEHAHRVATKVPSEIAQWTNLFEMGANVAIASGRPSGLIILDIDKKNNGYASLNDLERRFGELPITIRAHTGGGGRHYFFAAPRFEVRGRIGMLPGVDVRAEDQLFIVPPSRHKSGNVYFWDEIFHPSRNFPAPLPGWLLHKIQTKNTPKKKSIGHWKFA